VDVFTDFTDKNGNILMMSAAVCYSSDSMASRTSLYLDINIPPENCKLLVTPSKGI
jgi:hypothetical protein